MSGERRRLYGSQQILGAWRSGQNVGSLGNPRRAGMIPTGIMLDSDISGLGGLGCGGSSGSYGAYGVSVSPETVDAAIAAGGAAISAIGGAIKPRDPTLAAGKATAKQQKKYQKMLKRAAKVKDPVKRDRLMKAAEAYGRLAAGGMPDSVLAAQEASVESQLDAEPEAAEGLFGLSQTATYAVAGGAVIALLGGAAYMYKRNRK